jgi:hypothetical protein
MAMRYRLRTLLIVVAAIGSGLGWIGWQQRIVTARRAESSRLEQCGEGLIAWEDEPGFHENIELFIEGDDSRRISAVRRWLGDRNAEELLFLNSASKKRKAIDLFPEADIYFP